ncbi:MAG: hypothetical protein ABJE66_15870 [Deltaproteobacteria bacterium]
MIDKLIASDLAALARDDHQRIPVFTVPAPRAAQPILTWALVGAAAPMITMLAAGVALMALDVAPFGHYEPFVAPLTVAIASFVGLALLSRPVTLDVRLRGQLTYLFAGAALLIGTVACFFANWPSSDAMYVVTTDDSLYMSTWIGGHGSWVNVGFIMIAATLVVLVARRIAARLNPAGWANRPLLDAWSTGAMIVGVLVIVIWTNALFFQQRYWPLVHWRMPDPYLRNYIVGHVKAEMWFALTFRPWSDSMISTEQWDVGAAGVGILGVAIVTALAITREGRSRRSLWLRFMEMPLLVPLFVTFGTANLVRATVADGPDEAARPFAWAVVGVMLAFTSMILRRRRRREALS